MNVNVLNACLIIAWALISAGGVLVQIGAGLVLSGASLVGLSLLAARLAGGVYTPELP